MKEQHSVKSKGGPLQTLKQNQFYSNQPETQSALTQKINSAIKLLEKIFSDHKFKNLVNNINLIEKMNRKTDVRNFKGGFIPDKVKILEPRGKKERKHQTGSGLLPGEESLSDLRWHKRPPTAKKHLQIAITTLSSKKTVKNARELLSS